MSFRTRRLCRPTQTLRQGEESFQILNERTSITQIISLSATIRGCVLLLNDLEGFSNLQRFFKVIGPF